MMQSHGLDAETLSYHLSELEIARDASAPGHLLPPIPPGCRAVLDIGCGAGQTLIGSRLGDDVLAVGVDPDAAALALGRTITEELHFAAAGGEHLPFADAAFDLVFSRVALPYMNIPIALREMGRVLRPGGTVWLSLHPPRLTFTAMGRALKNGLLLQLFDRQVQWPFGRKRYESAQTGSGMRRALTRAGFTDVRVTDTHFLVVTATKDPAPGT
jgi:SAM-dependent methyltransferase